MLFYKSGNGLYLYTFIFVTNLNPVPHFNMRMFSKENLAKEVIEYRKTHNLSQRDLALKSEISLRTIQNIEARKNSSTDTVNKLLKVIGRQMIIIKI